MGSDVSSTADDFSLLEDMHGSSETSSLNSSEEQLESDQLSGWPCPITGQQNHLSDLSFLKSTALDSSILNSCHKEKSGSGSHGMCDKKDAIDHLVKSHNEGMISSHVPDPLNPGTSKCSCKFSIQYKCSCIDNCSAMGHLLRKSFDGGTIEQKVTGKHLQPLEYSKLRHDVITTSDTLSGEMLSEDQSDSNILASSWCNFQPLKIGHRCNLPSINPFSMNLMLTRDVLLQPMGTNGGKYKADRELTLPYFNFSSVEDPCKVYMDKLPTNSRCISVSSFPLDSSASTYDNQNDEYGETGHSGEDGLVDASLDAVDHKQNVLTVESGGSSWERLLGSFRKTVKRDATQKQNLLSTFEMPLDIIIDKCLLQEIMLQYPYVYIYLFW